LVLEIVLIQSIEHELDGVGRLLERVALRDRVAEVTSVLKITDLIHLIRAMEQTSLVVVAILIF
jgi:hypothetical protein